MGEFFMYKVDDSSCDGEWVPVGDRVIKDIDAFVPVNQDDDDGFMTMPFGPVEFNFEVEVKSLRKIRLFLRKKAKKAYKQACKNRYRERCQKRAYYWKYYRCGRHITHHLDIFEKLLEDTKIPQLFKYEWQRKLYDYANSRQYADFAAKKKEN